MSLGTAPVRHVNFADTVEVVEFEARLPAEFVPPPQLLLIDKVVEIPVVVQRQIRMVQKFQKSIEIPQAQDIDKVVDAPVCPGRAGSSGAGRGENN